MELVGAYLKLKSHNQIIYYFFKIGNVIRMKSTFLKMSLQKRITVSFVLLMIGVMTLIIVAEQVEYDEIRAHIVSKNMYRKVPDLQSDLTKGIKPDLPEGTYLYNEQTVPAPLRKYTENYHYLNNPIDHHLLVFKFNDQLYYLFQDGKKYKLLEFLIDIFAPLIILLCILCAFWIGRLTSAHVINPIERLADAVQKKQKPLPYQDETDEIGILARAFAQHSNELEQFLQRERFFVGDASHELRTPLAIISGAAETIVYQLPADSHLKSSAERIVKTTQEMQQQLSCLLLLSRDPQTLSQTQVFLYAILEECIVRCEPWLDKKSVSLILDVPKDTSILTNPELARSVFWNLLRNACQYTDQGEVRIILHDMTLIISDTGPGLPLNIDTQNFKRFSHKTQHNGEGLGLSIVQRIVEHLGWYMDVESLETGCRFSIEMHRS